MLTINCRISKIGFPTFLFKKEMNDKLQSDYADMKLISLRLYPLYEGDESFWTGNTGYQKKDRSFNIL